MKRFKSQIVLVAVLMLASACTGNRRPAQIAGDVAHNGQIVVDAVDKTQRFIVEQEAAGRIPRNETVDAMKAIGAALAAAKQASGYLDQIVKLDPGSAATDPLLKQLQDALALASTQTALAIVPIGNPTVRG